jgi:hypothetical protein
MKKLVIPITGLIAAFAMVGCKGPEAWTEPTAATPGDSATLREAKQFHPSTDVGVPPPTPAPNKEIWASLARGKGFSSRVDPFALQPRERAFETDQLSERVFSMGNGWRYDFVPAVETVVVPVVEPQPYRRLAGVIVADSILALIDMGNGQMQLIRPGQVIDGWTVVSIDSDKAILRRSGNRLPREVTVRLETAPSGGGFGPGGGGGGNGGGGGGTKPGLGNPGGAG